jgi:hypothetical protein
MPFVTRPFVAAIADGAAKPGTFRAIIGCLEKRILSVADHAGFS